MLSKLTDFLGSRAGGFGLEITPERLNLAQLTKQGASYKLAKLHSLEIPAGLFEEGKIVDSPALTEMIQSLLSTHKIRSKRVATAVPMREAIIRFMAIPAELNDQELREMVLNHEAPLCLPYPREEVDIDYQKLDIFEDQDGIEKVQVLLVATRREITDSYIMTLQQAGLQVDVLEVASFSLIRTIQEQLRQFSAKEGVVLVDIEFDSTEIAILVNGIPQFSRSISIGTFQLQNTLSRALNMPSTRNTEILQSMAIPLSIGDVSTSTQGAALNPGMNALVQLLGEIADEIKRSIDFYRSQAQDLEIDYLILAGPGGGLVQIDQFFTRQLSIPAVQIDPIEALSLEVEQEISAIDRSGLATVLGLSLREV